MVYGVTGLLGQLVTQTVYIIAVEPVINRLRPMVVLTVMETTLTHRIAQMECAEVRKEFCFSVVLDREVMEENGMKKKIAIKDFIVVHH
jgi:hypothetical protein